MRIQNFILLFLILLISVPAGAQVSCVNTLVEAKNLYESGVIDEIPSLLSGCMQSGFSRSQRIDAYKLIILAYLFDDEQFEAENTMNNFLGKYPEYKTMPNDPMEFVFLMKSFKTTSKYSFNVYTGANFSLPRLEEPFQGADFGGFGEQDDYNIGLQVGVGLTRRMTKHIDFNADVFYLWHNFSQVWDVDPDNPPAVEPINFKENITIVDLPLSMTINMGKKNIRFYTRLGGVGGLLTTSYIIPEQVDAELDPLIDNKIEIKDYRRSYYYGLLGGLGVKFKINRGYFVVDLRYQYSLGDMTNDKDRTSAGEVWTEHIFVDRDYYLDYFSINFGYFLSFYKTNKK